jgi:hypothetical protein
MDFYELNKKMNEISLELDPSYQSGGVKGSPPPIPKPYMQKQIYAKYPKGSKVDKATVNQIIKMYKNAGLDPLDAPVGHVQPDADGMYVIEHQYNEADDHERYYQTSQAYRRAYDKARAGNSPADIEREHQSDRDAMIRSSKDLRDLVKEMHSALDEIGFDAAFSRSHTTKPGNILKDIAHSIQYIADELRRMGMGDKRITSAASSRSKDR